MCSVVRCGTYPSSLTIQPLQAGFKKLSRKALGGHLRASTYQPAPPRAKSSSSTWWSGQCVTRTAGSSSWSCLASTLPSASEWRTSCAGAWTCSSGLSGSAVLGIGATTFPLRSWAGLLRLGGCFWATKTPSLPRNGCYSWFTLMTSNGCVPSRGKRSRPEKGSYRPIVYVARMARSAFSKWRRSPIMARMGSRSECSELRATSQRRDCMNEKFWNSSGLLINRSSRSSPGKSRTASPSGIVAASSFTATRRMRLLAKLPINCWHHSFRRRPPKSLSCSRPENRGRGRSFRPPEMGGKSPSKRASTPRRLMIACLS